MQAKLLRLLILLNQKDGEYFYIVWYDLKSLIFILENFEMSYEVENNKDREYFKKDFSAVKELFKRIRTALANNTEVKADDINLDDVIKYDNTFSYVYITLFQAGKDPIRWGSTRNTFINTVNRDILKLRQHKRFNEFDINDVNKCRIMLEYITEQQPVKTSKLQLTKFDENRFEPGITGLKLNFENNIYIYMPTDAWTKSHNGLKQALNQVIRQTSIKNITNSMTERAKILYNAPHTMHLIKSRAFVSYKEDILPLYRGTTLNEYSAEGIKDIALNSINWVQDYMKPDGRFMYYYDCKDDNYKDHEHPDRTEDNLYYNDLRHCGGVISLIRAYQLTRDEIYIKNAKRGLDFITSITREHEVNGKRCGYVYYNNKAKLGGTGVALVAMMKYRQETKDTCYDDYIRLYARHIVSRVYKTGEMLGYFIHPRVQNGNELYDLSDEERRFTFSFYYPGEALLGLALVANHFDDKELVSEIIPKAQLALDWLVDERPKIYADLFTALPSDGWLMQAIEEWVDYEGFKKDNYINFVFKDAGTMIEKTYKRDDSPYIDFEGGYYYNYGDHFYPDGARSEGLVAAYYLAAKLGREELAQTLLEACRKTALSQMYLYNTDKNNYAHKNPEKSVRSIRFKATRQWVRVDSIQHVACFFLRLYFAEKGIKVN